MKTFYYQTHDTDYCWWDSYVHKDCKVLATQDAKEYQALPSRFAMSIFLESPNKDGDKGTKEA